jgi:hypothetical protein
MIHHQSNTPLPQTKSSPSSFSSRIFGFCEHIRRHRCGLGASALLVVVALIIGTIYVAHQYYTELGGQGWLKIREQYQHTPGEPPQVYLPFKKIEKLSEGNRFFGWTTRGNIPFYTCGDQQESCESYGQPVSKSIDILSLF